MKIFVKIYFIPLFLVLFVNTSGADQPSNVSTNVTYALCVVNETTITVVSQSFSGECLVEEFHEHFIKDIVGKTICHPHTTSGKRSIPTTAQRYGYGFLAVFVVSILSLGGLLAFPFIYKISFQYVLATFTALAVGTLFGDAMFHLIPFVLGVHDHESDGHGHAKGGNHSLVIVPSYQWKILTAVMILYSFYLLEIFLHWFTNHRQNKNAIHFHGHNHATQHGNMSQILASNEKEDSNERKIMPDNSLKVTRATGWMIILGDGIHNFADGLAIGAAFSENLTLGLTTSIAIGCHELPHEFGDYAVLIQSGFSHYRALFWNFLSAMTAFIGFFVGTAASTNKDARRWIFSITIGMFLYIALVDLLPSLISRGQFYIKQFISINIGFLMGIVLMFTLAIFEDRLVHLGP